MIPIKLEYREGTLLRKQQDEIDDLRKQLDEAIRNIAEKGDELVEDNRKLVEDNRMYLKLSRERATLRKQLEDALRGSEENAVWFDCLKIDYDIIKKQLAIAVEALKKIDAYPKSDMWFQHNIYVQDALAEIERTGGKNG
jgi:hypothetical protein